MVDQETGTATLTPNIIRRSSLLQIVRICILQFHADYFNSLTVHLLDRETEVFIRDDLPFMRETSDQIVYQSTDGLEFFILEVESDFLSQFFYRYV